MLFSKIETVQKAVNVCFAMSSVFCLNIIVQTTKNTHSLLQICICSQELLELFHADNINSIMSLGFTIHNTIRGDGGTGGREVV